MFGPQIILRPFCDCQAKDNLSLLTPSRLDRPTKDRHSPSHEKPKISKEAKNDIECFLFYFTLPLHLSACWLQSGPSSTKANPCSPFSSSASTRRQGACCCQACPRSACSRFGPGNLTSRRAYLEHSQTMEARTTAADASGDLLHTGSQFIQSNKRGMLHFLLWPAARRQHSRKHLALERAIPTSPGTIQADPGKNQRDPKKWDQSRHH